MEFNDLNVNTQQCAANNVYLRMTSSKSFASKSNKALTTDEQCARYIKASKQGFMHMSESIKQKLALVS